MAGHRRFILKVDNLSKHYSTKKILDCVDFEVYHGEILGIVGLSGSGKSTLLKIICGYTKQTGGKIIYDGKVSRFFRSIKEMAKIRSLIGFSSQEPSFYPNLTVQENLIYFGTLLDIKRLELHQRIEEILKILDLYDAKKLHAKDLSEGMKKRLDLACSIIHEPKILILDEPTANLDYILREELLSYIKRLNQKRKMTILFVSHYLEEIKEISDRIAILAKTQITIHPNDRLIKRRFHDAVTTGEN